MNTGKKPPPRRKPRRNAGPAAGTAHPQARTSRVILFNKPYGVVCQFTGGDGRPTLKDYLPQPGVYPAGRLDADSEGLVVLTADGPVQHRITDPRHKLVKIYWVEVEGVPDAQALQRLRTGVRIRDYTTRPATVRVSEPPPWLWPRVPPVRFRRHIPTRWLELSIIEGRNRQVRHMTAAVGLPTLRLIRFRVGPWSLEGLDPGAWRSVEADVGPLLSTAWTPAR